MKTSLCDVFDVPTTFSSCEEGINYSSSQSTPYGFWNYSTTMKLFNIENADMNHKSGVELGCS